MPAIKFSNRKEDFSWVSANVYGPNNDSAREDFWGSVSAMLSQWEVQRCIGGDFNIIRFPHEKKGGT